MPISSLFLPPHDEPDSDDTIYVGEYRPYRISGMLNPKFDDRSRLLLDLKKRKPEAIDYFYREAAPLVPPNIPIVVVPSCDPNNAMSGIRLLARRLATNRRLDATMCLVRHTAIPKLSLGGDRDMALHLQTIHVEHPELIRGRTVFLLDDVTTTGNSLRACKQILLQAGADVVQCMALGRTTH